MKRRSKGRLPGHAAFVGARSRNAVKRRSAAWLADLGRTGACLLAVALAAACHVVVPPARVVAHAEPAPTTPAQAWDLFDRILDVHVDQSGRVNHAALARDPRALERLYLWLAHTSPAASPEAFPSRADALAYWINAYNALVLVSVSRHWPIASVAEVPSPRLVGLVSDTAGFFHVDRFVLGGEPHSLQSLREDVIRERFADPRVHFALATGTRGSPGLARRSFRGADLDPRLDAVTQVFLAREEALRIDAAGHAVVVSAIFSQYSNDFATAPAAQGSVLGWLAENAPTAERPTLERARERNWPLRSAPWDPRLDPSPSLTP